MSLPLKFGMSRCRIPSAPEGLGEDVGVFPSRRNILKFDFTGEDTLTDKMLVHLNVLSPGVEYGVLC